MLEARSVSVVYDGAIAALDDVKALLQALP